MNLHADGEPWVYSHRHRCFVLPRRLRLTRRQRRIARDLLRRWERQ